jgi:hypothetical protein
MDKNDIWLAVINQVASGIGALLGPKRLKETELAKAEAKRRELLLMEKTRLDIQDVRAGKKAINDKGEIVDVQALAKSELVFPSEMDWERNEGKYFKSLVNFSEHEAKLQQLERTLNLRQIAIYADDVIEESKTEQVDKNGDKTVDPDWFTKWRNNAQDASSDELRRLWAKILAGEMNEPGTFSVSTLELINRMSKPDAQLIEKISGYVVDRSALYRQENFEPYKNDNISLSNFLELETLGFISGSDGMLTYSWGTIRDGKYVYPLNFHQFVLLLERDNPEGKVTINVSPLTRAGKEILSLISTQSKVDFVEELGKVIKSRNNWLTVQLYELIENLDNALKLKIMKEIKD